MLMRKYLVILFLVMSCVVNAAQDSLPVTPAADSVRYILHSDTLDARDLTGKSDDAWLLDLIGKQSQVIADRNDSIHNYRLAHDTTTIIPLHLGYADSIRCARMVARQGGTTPLCVPLLYIPPQPQLFQPLTYETGWKAMAATDRLEKYKSDSLGQSRPTLLNKNARQEARRFVTTHAAGLYVGVAEPVEESSYNFEETHSLYELNIPQKSIMKDAVADAAEKLKAIKNQHNPWFKEDNLMAQITQNYISPNWFEGGNSTFSIYGSARGTIKYDDKKLITWENYGEWTIGATTVSGDSLRKANMSQDIFRLYSKLGVKIVPKLYGSFSAEYRMQMFPTYKTNTMKLKTGFATPIRFNLALGLDYKPVKGLSLVFSPAAFKLVHANDTVNAPYTSFGIKAGTKTLAEFGTSTRVEWTWKPLREVAIEAKFYAYTNYRMIELDLEVACDFIINRFMSARAVLHPRYDTTRIMEGEKHAKIQYKELISVGFAHKFY